MVANGYDEMGILTDLIENGVWDEAGVAKMFRTIGMTKEGHQMTLRKKIAAAAKSRAPQAPQVNVVPLAFPAAPEGEAELFVEAIAAPPVEVSQRKKENFTAKEWFDLGQEGGGHRYGRKYTTHDCYAKSLELDPTDAAVWHFFGEEGGGVVNGYTYSKKECFLTSLGLDPNNAVVWYNFGYEGGGVVNGRIYSAKDCFMKSLELDPTDAVAWLYFGYENGGVFRDRTYSKKDCFIKSLELDPTVAVTWSSLRLKRMLR